MVKPSCEDCHQNFHEVQSSLFMGTGGNGVPDHPSTMFESGLNCRGCHIQKETTGDAGLGGTTMMASGVVCTPCHDPGYDKILEGWKRRNNEKLGQIKGILNRVNSAVNGLTGNRRMEADSLVNAAKHNIVMVDLGHGIHNIPFAESLLGTAFEQLSAAGKLAGGLNLPTFETGLPKQDAQCMNCHYGVETMVVQRQGRDFPHSTHVLGQKLACTVCHSNEVKHGTLSLSPTNCNECHHKADNGITPDCAKCHQLQSSIFKGDTLWGKDAFPDPMSEGGLSCQDCHVQEAGKVVRPTGESCVGCHEAGYDKILQGWKDKFNTDLTTIDSLLHLCRNVDLTGVVEVRHRADLIRQDHSSGTHNNAMLDDVMRKDADWLRNFIKEHGLDLAKPIGPN